MEYFTLADDLEEIQSSKIRLRNRIFAGAAFIILFLLMRGSGAITIEYSKTYLRGNHVSQEQISEVFDDGKNGIQTTGGFTLDRKDEIFSKELGFNIVFFSLLAETKPDEKKYLENLIKDKISAEKSLNERFKHAVVSVKKYEISGSYWIPLIKDGKSSYVISVGNEYFQDTYSANVSGDFDFEVYGICTVDKLQRNIAEKTAGIVVNFIKDDYKK